MDRICTLHHSIYSINQRSYTCMSGNSTGSGEQILTLFGLSIIPGILWGWSALFVMFLRGLCMPIRCISGGRNDGSPKGGICMWGIGGMAAGDLDMWDWGGRPGDFCLGRVPWKKDKEFFTSLTTLISFVFMLLNHHQLVCCFFSSLQRYEHSDHKCYCIHNQNGNSFCERTVGGGNHIQD